MSFHDDADQPPTRTARSRPPTSGRPPQDQQVLVRRLVAAGLVVVVLILLIVGVKGCIDSQKTDDLKAFNRDISQIQSDSDAQVGRPLFKLLSGASGRSPTDLQNQVNQLRVLAEEQVARAKRLDGPDETKTAQRNAVLGLELRADGVARIARYLQPAVSKDSAAAQAGVQKIAGWMRAFDAADVLWTVKVAPLVAQALSADGIAVGGTGEQIAGTRFLPDVQWLQPSFVAGQLGSAGASASGPAAPGTHGHSLDSVSVGGTDLSTSGPNSIPASPPPTFTVHLTNGGQNAETGVVVTVSVEGGPTPIKATKTIPRTEPGQSTSVDVPLGSSPPTGQQLNVVVTVAKVSGEANVANNSQTYPVTFS